MVVAVSFTSAAMAAEPIIIGIPAAQSGLVGVTDDNDWTNGAMMAIEKLNANGSGLVRPCKAKIIDLYMLSPGEM